MKTSVSCKCAQRIRRKTVSPATDPKTTVQIEVHPRPEKKGISRDTGRKMSTSFEWNSSRAAKKECHLKDKVGVYLERFVAQEKIDGVYAFL